MVPLAGRIWNSRGSSVSVGTRHEKRSGISLVLVSVNSLVYLAQQRKDARSYCTHLPSSKVRERSCLAGKK